MENTEIKIELLPYVDNGKGYRLPPCVSLEYGEQRLLFGNMQELMRFSGSLQEAVMAKLGDIKKQMLGDV